MIPQNERTTAENFTEKRVTGRLSGASSALSAVMDQGIVGATSFLTVLVLSRSCSKEEVGLYSLAWTVVMFLTAAQGNLILVPYTMFHNRRDEKSRSMYAGSVLTHQFIASLVGILCFAAMAGGLSVVSGPRGLQPVLLVLAGAAPFLLLREFIRYFSFAHLKISLAATIDVIVSVGQLSALALLWYWNVVSAAGAYAVMGGACAAATACWWLLNKTPIRIELSSVTGDWRENWAFGRWAMASQLAGLWFFVMPWILAAVHGEKAAGELFACNTLIGPSHLFVVGANNYLQPRMAKAFAAGGVAALIGVMRKATWVFAVLLGGVCAAALLFGNAAAVFVYGQQFDGSGTLITVLALSIFADALELTFNNGLWAMNRPSANLIGDMVKMVVTLCIALWLVFPCGAIGIAIATFVGRMSGTVARLATMMILFQPQYAESPAA